MTDEQLAIYLGIDSLPSWRTVIARLAPKRRASYERMKEIEDSFEAWVRNDGPRPEGVLIDLEMTVGRRSRLQ